MQHPNASGPPSSVGSRALRWLDALERARYFDDFRRPNLLGFAWSAYGDLDAAGDHRSVEDASSPAPEGEDVDERPSGWWEDGVGDPIRYLSLRIAQAYAQSYTHFGRGVHARCPPHRPRHFSCHFRLRLDLVSPVTRLRRSASFAHVGYLILSDGVQSTDTSQGLFGTEAVFCSVVIKPNHRAMLLAVDDCEERVIVPELRTGSWGQLCLAFDWEQHAVDITYRDFASASWPEEASPETQSTSGSSVNCKRVRFRGKCEQIGQLSLLSTKDHGHATCAWTDVTLG